MQRENGFTLTELLIAVTISGVVIAAIYSAYLTQHRAYENTEKISAVQQNLRAAMYYMEREIRMAGFDPLGTANSGFFNVTQNPAISPPNNIEFSWDGAASGTTPNGADEDPAEHILYRVNATRFKERLETADIKPSPNILPGSHSFSWTKTNY